jgi:hypothetical protein
MRPRPTFGNTGIGIVGDAFEATFHFDSGITQHLTVVLPHGSTGREGWWTAPEWVGRLIERPVLWLDRRLETKLEGLDQQEPDPAQKALERTEARLARMIPLFGPDGGPTASARVVVATQIEKMHRFAEASPLERDGS